MPLIADTLNDPRVVPNSRGAVEAAVNSGFKEVLISTTYCPKADSHPAAVLCCPPFLDEYRLLSSMNFTEWYREFIGGRGYPRAIPALELLSVSGIERFWINVDCLTDQREHALELIAEVARTPVVAVFVDGAAPRAEGCADTTGNAEFIYCRNAIHDAQAALGRKRDRALAHGSACAAAHKIVLPNENIV